MVTECPTHAYGRSARHASASVARTVIQLGVEITEIDTRSKLSEGIELALSMIGKKIAPKVNRTMEAEA